MLQDFSQAPERKWLPGRSARKLRKHTLLQASGAPEPLQETGQRKALGFPGTWGYNNRGTLCLAPTKAYVSAAVFRQVSHSRHAGLRDQD